MALVPPLFAGRAAVRPLRPAAGYGWFCPPLTWIVDPTT